MEYMGKKLKEAVRNSNLKAEEFAEKMGMSQSNLFNLYTRPLISHKHIKKACEILDLNPDYFLSIDESPIQTTTINSNHAGKLLESAIEELRTQLDYQRKQYDLLVQQNTFLQNTLSKVLDMQGGKLEASDLERLTSLAKSPKLTVFRGEQMAA